MQEMQNIRVHDFNMAPYSFMAAFTAGLSRKQAACGEGYEAPARPSTTEQLLFRTQLASSSTAAHLSVGSDSCVSASARSGSKSPAPPVSGSQPGAYAALLASLTRTEGIQAGATLPALAHLPIDAHDAMRCQSVCSSKLAHRKQRCPPFRRGLPASRSARWHQVLRVPRPSAENCATLTSD